MVGKPEQDNERTFSVWPRLIAMFTSFMLVAVVFTTVAFLYPPVEAPKPDRPHIIFILADDLGWNDVSVHGSPQIPTPNLDALAAAGLLLHNYYSGPLCSPSRGALLAGKYAHRLGLNRDLRPSEPSGLPLNVNILPGYLKKLGYATHMVGKWHLGYFKKSYLPTRRGFDSFFGFLNDNIDYYDYTSYYKETESNDIDESVSESASTENSGNPVELFGIDLWENEEVVRDFRGEYVTDVLTDKALDVIEDHNVTKPLFLYVSEAAVHAGNPFFPVQSPADLYERNNHIGDNKRRTYAGVVSSLDNSVGRIFSALHRRDMLRKTIVVVCSDNGAEAGSNWPLRGAKGSLWEGGVRSLALLWSPLLKLRQPRVVQHLMHVTDWLPSLYHAAGGDVSDLGDIDGINMWPSLLKKGGKSPREEVLLHVDAAGGGLRKGDFKLLVQSPGPADWFSLEDDAANVSLPMDEWVWGGNGSSVVRQLLLDTGQWLLPENSSEWRAQASLECGENFLPVSGKCDFALGPCLYNVREDPCEYKNIADLYPEIVDKLVDRLRDLNASSLPVESQGLDPLGNPLCHDFAHVPWVDEEEFDCPLQ